MSGGSYNYLCWHLDDLERQRSDITAIAERLEGSGYEQAAEATWGVLAKLDEARRLAEGLEDVWHAVEWADSGDYSEDQVGEAVGTFRQRWDK